MISNELGHKEIWHEGAIPGFISLNVWYPDDDTTIIVLDNVFSPAYDISHALAAILFGQKYEIPKEHRAIALAADGLQKYVGQYPLNPQVTFTVRREGDHLIFQATGKGPLPIYPESANEFFARRANLQISFVQGTDGKVTGLVLHETGHDVPASRISDTTPPPPK
ncbi:MAG TPA: DUF3471 domain-containing protein [Granulicella sp.]